MRFFPNLSRLLKIMLQGTKNHGRLSDVVRKVIAFMTSGIDVSCLFTEMSMVPIVTRRPLLLALLHNGHHSEKNDIFVPYDIR